MPVRAPAEMALGVGEQARIGDGEAPRDGCGERELDLGSRHHAESLIGEALRAARGVR